MIRQGIPLKVLDVRHAWGHQQIDPQLESHLANTLDDLHYPIHLYHMPAVFFESLFQNNPGLAARGKFHVASIAWEASQIPASWLQIWNRLDAIIVHSNFVFDVVANSLTLTPVLLAKQPVDLEWDTKPDRTRWDFRDGETVFVASLDPNSDPARKNPLALVSAFRAAFPDLAERVRLVIRLNNAASQFGQATANSIAQAGSGDNRIVLRCEPMQYADVISLYASGDAYVSLHRGEGLGLGLMESMALGKPVIATAWSGNMSFMDSTCGCLVRYRLIPVSGNWGFFRPEVIGPEARWADPLLEDAVGWMRELHQNRQLRIRIGQAARERMRVYQREAWDAQWLQELGAIWRSQTFLPKVVEKLSFPG